MTERDPSATDHTLTAATLMRNGLAQRPSSAFLTATEAAVYLDCSRRSLMGLVAARELAPDGRGTKRRMLFRRATLDAFLERRAQQAPPGDRNTP